MSMLDGAAIGVALYVAGLLIYRLVVILVTYRLIVTGRSDELTRLTEVVKALGQLGLPERGGGPPAIGTTPDQPAEGGPPPPPGDPP